MTGSADLGIFGVSVIAGIIDALAGVGGGILIIPALTLLFGVDIRVAIGASIVSVIATSSRHPDNGTTKGDGLAGRIRN